MSFNWIGLVIILVIAGCYVGLWFVGKKVSFMWHMLIALGGGLLIGVILQLIFPIPGATDRWTRHESMAFAFDWLNIIRTAYGNLLQIMVMPLVVVAIISGILKATDTSKGQSKIGKGAAVAIATLLITCGLAALLSIITSTIFGLNAANIDSSLGGAVSEAKTTSLTATIAAIFGSTNILDALSVNSILPIMFLSLIFAFIISGLKKSDDEDSARAGAKLQTVIDVAYEFVMGLVDLVIGLAPYGVFAYILNFGANTGFENYLTLGLFVIASYVAMIAMFAVHIIISLLCGVTPGRFFKKAGKALIMGFSTRSSMATLPTTITCMEDMGVDSTLATFAGTFSTCVGQNGCGGTYPAMLATMVYASMGINLFSGAYIVDLILLILIIMLCSLGIAGVGGGATAAGLMLFGTLGWSQYIPIIGILFSVEALIDMGRTALNVSGGFVAGIVSGRLTGNLNLKLGKGGKTPDADGGATA